MIRHTFIESSPWRIRKESRNNTITFSDGSPLTVFARSHMNFTTDFVLNTNRKRKGLRINLILVLRDDRHATHDSFDRNNLADNFLLKYKRPVENEDPHQKYAYDD